MDNDTLLILKRLFECREVDVYQLHAETKIPPTTLYKVLEGEKTRGNVSREGLKYILTSQGESYWADELVGCALNPSTAFKSVPSSYTVPQVAADDVSVLAEIVQ